MKHIFFAAALIMMFGNIVAINQTNLPAPYNSIKILPPDLHGWMSGENRKNLYNFITQRNVKTVVEIGSWLGLSATFMANILPEDGILFAVDHWLGSIEHYQNQDWKNRLKNLHQQFLSNVIHMNLAHKIVPCRMSSLEAAAALNIQADLIYIDGSHEEIDVFNDIMAWYPHLAENGILTGDDFGWSGVRKAVYDAANQLGLEVKFEGNFWYYEKRN